MLREIAYVVLGIAILGYTTEWAISAFDDPREPRRISSKVPLVGHLLGLFRHGMGYYDITGRKTNTEMYTLGVGNMKIYVCNALNLVTAIQKASKTVSFRPFMLATARQWGGASASSLELLTEAHVDELGQLLRSTLMPGPHLDEQNLRMGAKCIIQVDALAQMTDFGLWEWTKDTVLEASSFAIYGDRHPYRTPELKADYWEWNSYLAMHLLGIDPLGKGYAPRQRIFDALTEYGRNVPANASKLVKDKIQFYLERGWSQEELFKQMAPFAVALFSNTSPAAFWTFYEVYSRPDILEQIRAEIAANAVEKRDGAFHLDVSALKMRCPLVLSVYQEMQRTRTQHASIRKIMEDTLIDGRYLLKKGNYLQMPGEPINKSEHFWGSSSREFDPYRFVPKEKGDSGVSNNKSKFTAWGAAPHLCPARQFASTEILILVVLVAMRLDLTPMNKTGEWVHMPYKTDHATTPGPAHELRLQVKPREAWSGTWKLEMGTSMTKLPLASG